MSDATDELTFYPDGMHPDDPTKSGRAPSAAAIKAAFREGRQHGGSVRGAPGARLEHLCACGAVFQDSPDADGDDLWQLHATEMELRAAYAVDFPARVRVPHHETEP